MPSRRLLYEKVLRESALLLPRWGDKAGWLGNPGCRLATLGFALGCELYAPSGRSLTALNFYRTPIKFYHFAKRVGETVRALGLFIHHLHLDTLAKQLCHGLAYGFVMVRADAELRQVERGQ